MMIIGGIGYLIAFLKRYQWSAFSFNFVLAAFTYQWSLLVQGRDQRTTKVPDFQNCFGPCLVRDKVVRGSLVQGFIFEDKNTENSEIPTILNGTMPYWEPSQFAFIRINLAAILEAEFSAATCLISFCCVLGVASPSQCIIMVLSETVFYKVRYSVKLGKKKLLIKKVTRLRKDGFLYFGLFSPGYSLPYRSI